jgi:hypothetical protein
VIEAVFENMDIKKSVFERLDGVARLGAILTIPETPTLRVRRTAQRGRTFGPNGRRRHRRFTVRLQVGVRLASDLPQLLEEAAALGVNRFGHASPSRDMGIGVDTGHPGITVAAGRDRRRIGDDQTAVGGALGVAFGDEVARNKARIGPHPRQRSHHHTWDNR